MPSSPVPKPSSTTGPRKTVFLIVHSGAAIRNILRTDVLKVLKAQPGLRLVIFSPLTDAEFRREFEAPNVVVEPLPDWKGNSVVRFVRSLKKDLWAGQTGTGTFKANRTRKDGRWLRATLLRLLTANNSPARVQSLLKWLDRTERRFTPPLANEWFDRYQPDLVFYTTIYSPSHCLEIAATQRGVRSAAFILSWDNPTSKGPFPVQPDRAILWNDILREELIQHHDFPPEKIFVSGAPQFDIYTDFSAFHSRAQYFQKWGLDPAKVLITYTTGTTATAPFDHEVVELLYQSIRGGALRRPAQLLVRLHPKDRYADYIRFEKQPDLVLQLPGRRGATDDSWNPSREDMYGLAELMCYSSVVVNVASTITIDAAAFDTPVVNVAFDGFATKPLADSCLRYYDYDHYRRIMQTGGVALARSAPEMMTQIQTYLDQPELHAEGRQRIRDEQCWKLDGQSGRRIAEFLIAFLEQPR
jgi:hypothetical protein